VTVDALHAAARWLGCLRIDLEECGSTNDEAARIARAGARHGTIVIARAQRAGRGRDGRVWASPPGGLYLSAVVRPPLPLVDVPPMTLAIGVGLCDAVRATGAPAVLKWPNDVLVDRTAPPYGGAAGGAQVAAGDRTAPPYGGAAGGAQVPAVDRRKLAGVLVEAQSQGGKLESVIVGIGVNLHCAFEGELAARAITLAEAARSPVDSEAFLARVLVHVERWIDRYVASGLEAIVPAWHDRMAPGLSARATVDGAPLIGHVQGLDQDGALLLRDDSGRVHRVRSGDVEVLRAEAF
jgi:BirA family biotin operon repressor/biotin-[acetyl-CoA-carboxylase] ligase